MEYVTIADKVAKSDNGHSAIIGHTFIPGVGRVSLFSDRDAREAWVEYVGALKDKGQFVALASNGKPVDVVWGIL